MDDELDLGSLGQVLAGEFDLVGPVSVAPLDDIGHRTLKVSTARGVYVAKRPWRRADVDLYAQVAPHLQASGVRQPQLLPARGGGWVGPSGHAVLEFIPGSVVMAPTRTQTTAVMVELARFHHVLSRRTFAWQPDRSSFWNRVADPGFLLATLPAQEELLGKLDPSPLRTALDFLDAHPIGEADLAPQVVHGDIGPDNVIMAGDEVAAIIDFTPFERPAVFALTCALYWYHAYGHASLSVCDLSTSVAAYAQGGGPWGPVDAAALPTMLVLEALRRVATILCAPGAGELGEPFARRWSALSAVIDTVDDLAEVVS